MLRVAAITDPGHPGLRPDDVPLTAAFAAEGMELVPVPWGERIEEARFDAAVVRTPWDYFERPAEFLAWVDGAVHVPLHNDARVLHWNHDKGYLFELESRGAAVLPPTLRIDASERTDDATRIARELGCETFVLKPTISGGAFRTRVVASGERIEWSTEDVGTFLAQAFVPEIQRSGEWSVMVFAGEVSHTVRKIAKPGDFRVQSEYGGDVVLEEPRPELTSAALEAVRGAEACVGGERTLLYARVDMVWSGDGPPLLMELELIEPELFFLYEVEAAGRFARAARRVVRPKP